MIADRHIMRENIFQKCSSHQISRVKKKKKISQNRNKLGITADKGQVNVGCENEREGRQRRNIYIDLSNTPHCPPASRNRQCFLSFPFFFFVHLNEEFGLRHSPQIMPPENRRYTKKRQLKLLTLKHVKNGKSSPPARYEQYTLQRRQSGGIAAFGVSR